MDILVTTNKHLIDEFNDETSVNAGKYIIAVNELAAKHFFCSTNEQYVCFFLGNHYEEITNKEFLEKIFKYMQFKDYNAIMNLDGEFVCGLINKKSNCIVLVTDREGIIPLYYRKEIMGWSITTEQSLLFYDYGEDDINYGAVNDFLRFGTLIGNETLSKRVLRSRGGTVFDFEDDGLCTSDRIYKFHYNEKQSNPNIESLIKNITYAYGNAISKRVKGNENNTCIFMSGGMDSRFLLSLSNRFLKEKLSTYCFGQKYSEEVNVARLCAEVENNPFYWIETQPRDFVLNAEEYEKIVCGADMFPQSYIIKAAQSIQKTHFVTGFALDAYMGGTFLNEEAISYNGYLDEFVKEHLSLIKMNVFSKSELLELCINPEIGNWIFGYGEDNLVIDAKQYRGLDVVDTIQAFAIDNRAKNLVLQRELTPAKYMDCSYVSCDRDFLKEVSKIPANLRCNHRFYQELYKETSMEYAKIVYNNTTLPILAPVEEWKEATNNEAKRERMFERIINKHNSKNNDKIYYPHFYSDFNGYSRYDDDWKFLLEKYLLAEDAFLTNRIFNPKKIYELYKEHLSGKKNRRKELVYLASLEVFFKTMLKS